MPILLTTIISISSGGAVAADYKQNSFTLAYDGAIIENVKGKVNIHQATYKLDGIDISANVYTPANYDTSHQYPAMVVAHPNSTFRYTMSSLLDLMNFDAASNMELINQPLLMMAGSRADSLYMTLDAFKDAHNSRNKELFLIDGATHIETYWKPQYVNQAMGKLTQFFGETLK